MAFVREGVTGQIQSTRSRRHITALDGLRGFAVAGVLLFHGGHLTGGYLGVDLFFVLSGFLITSLLLSESADRGAIGLAGFWSRRARRLLPALAGMLVGVALYCVLFASPSDLAGIRGDALATVLYGANWRSVFSGHDYWSLFSAPSPLQHTWSLAIEEQFYLVWPLVIAMLAWRRRATPKVVLVLSLVGAGVSASLMALLYHASNTSRVYYGTDTRAAGILLGAALAAWFAMERPARRGSRVALELAALAGAGWLAYAWTQLDGQSPALYHGGFLVTEVAVVALIAAAAHDDRGPVSRVFELAPLCALGLISYGVYLWHWPVYLVLDQARTGLNGWPLLLVRVAATLVIATVSYMVIEQPVRRGRLTARAFLIVGPAVAVSVVALIVVVTSSAPPPIATASVSPSAWKPRTSVGASAPQRVRVLVVGDSVAVSLFPGLQHSANSAGVDAVLGAVAGCDAEGRVRRVESSSGQFTTSCPPAWPMLVSDVRPDIVLLVDSGVWSMQDEQADGHVVSVGTPTWTNDLLTHWQQTIDTLTATGAHVAMPTIACVRPSSQNSQFAHPVDDPRLVAAVNGDLAELARRNPGRLTLVDLGSYVCPTGRYQEQLGSVEVMRPDGVHYSNAGSDLVGRWLAPQLATIGSRTFAPLSTP